MRWSEIIGEVLWGWSGIRKRRYSISLQRGKQIKGLKGKLRERGESSDR